MKKGLTLVELIVVIGIIGILAAILLGKVSGGLESARSARCLANLKKLASADQMAAAGSCYYPLAGSRETFASSGKGNGYTYTDTSTRGWISWYSKDVYPTTAAAANSGMTVSMYESSDIRRYYAITNGMIWPHTARSMSVYVCPNHAKEKRKLNPLFSYVMNAYFGWSPNPGQDLFTGEEDDRITSASGGERRLLFAEIQFVDDDKLGLTAPVSRDYKTDAILQYKGCTSKKDEDDADEDLSDSYRECIGFNHKIGQFYHAHIVFQDGHVERLVCPKNGLKEEDAQNLTQWLCRGLDVAFDGSSYTKLKD